MADFNDIFGYKVYKPPPEKDFPVVQDLNVVGEVITLIDPSADVIKDPAVQKILKSLDGERTVKIEDLPPDVRYDGWNKKAQYDKQIIGKNSGKETNIQPQLPVVNHNLLKEDINSQHYSQEALRQAQLTAQTAKNSELEFSRQLQETKLALEKEIHRQLVEQLTIRAQKKSVTPEQQALIEKLYLDLRLINPDLAFATLKASAALSDQLGTRPVLDLQPPAQQRVVFNQPPPPPEHSRQPASSDLVHNQGSIVNAREEPSSSSKHHHHKSKSSKSSKSHKSSSRKHHQ